MGCRLFLPPLYVTSLTILKMMNLAIFPDQISYLFPTHFLGFFRESIKRWFTVQGFSYEDYLRVYFSLVEPFIAEFPRLLLSILSIRILRIKTTMTGSGPSPSPSTQPNRPHHRPQGQSQG